jgi:prepilin-type N-terminal cleavage/methylation domain-containing protein
MIPLRLMKLRGFTLVEVLVSITLIAIALLGVLGSIAYGTKHSGSGADLSEATHLARTIMTYVQETTLLDTVEIELPWLTEESGLNDPATAFRQLDAPPLGAGLRFEPVQLERFRRRIQSQRVIDDPLNYRYKLARLRVSIFWTSKQGERQVELTGLVTTSRD